MKLAYVAYDRDGREVTATTDASSTAEATENLRRKGLFVSQIHEAATDAGVGEASDHTGGGRLGGKGKRLRRLSSFMRQMQVMIACQTPMVDALRAVERQATDEAWRQTLTDVRTRVEEGMALSVAMECHGEVFDNITRSLIAAGESTGSLTDMFNWLAVTTQKQVRTRNIVTSALAYPMLLMAVTVGVLSLVLLFVVPRFDGLFKSLDAPLPPTTAMLIDFSAWLKGYWWMIGGFVAAATVGALLWVRTDSGRRHFHTFMLRAPKVGTMVRAFVNARIARLLGGLIEGHVSILDALDLTGRAVRNCHYVDLMRSAGEAISQGETLSSVFRRTDLITPALHEAISTGEQSGQVGTLLLQVSEFMDEENEVRLRSLTSIIEPIILITMGLLVGGVALSMFMPLFDLTAMT